MPLRCLDNNLFTFLDFCKDSSQIFVVTDRGFEKQAQVLIDRYDADISFINDLSYIDIGVSKSEWNDVPVPPEWIKLEHALRYLILWEQKINHCFEYIHGFRTDVSYLVGFQEYIKPLIQADFPQNMILHYWASSYIGSRKTMLGPIGFLEYFIKYKTDKKFFKQVIN